MFGSFAEWEGLVASDLTKSTAGALQEQCSEIKMSIYTVVYLLLVLSTCTVVRLVSCTDLLPHPVEKRRKEGSGK